MTLSVTRAMTKRIIKLSSLVSLFLLLVACGQKGPLHMPAERETTPVEEQPETPRDNSQGERAPDEVIEGIHDRV